MIVSHDQVDCVYFKSLYNMYTGNFHSFRDIGHCFQDTTSFLFEQSNMQESS